MSAGDGPTVSVVTPFYNTADYLGECIESVLGQTFLDFEYVLADNASTDGSGEIARRYAREDHRIRYVRFEELLPQVPNYNRALREASRKARYCKMAQADDRLMPRCLEEMVRFWDDHPEASIVGAYTLLQDSVFLDGLDFYESLVPGREICRRYFEDGPYLLGSPTTHMYRMAEVAASDTFFDESLPFEDADKSMRLVLDGHLGFVHQVLTFVRTSNDSISTRIEDFHIDALTRRCLFHRYGSEVFPTTEASRLRRRLASRHYRILGEGVLLSKPDAFWRLHEEAANRVGLRIRWPGVAAGAVVVFFRWLVNPESTLRSLWAWWRR